MPDKQSTADGTERLCQALYGRPARARDYLGGSEAKMLHDAASRIEALQAAAYGGRGNHVPMTSEICPTTPPPAPRKK